MRMEKYDHYNINIFKEHTNDSFFYNQNFIKLDTNLYYVYNKTFIDYFYTANIHEYALRIQQIFDRILDKMNLSKDIVCPIFINKNPILFDSFGVCYNNKPAIVISIDRCERGIIHDNCFDGNSLVRHVKTTKATPFEILIYTLIHELQHFIQYNITKKLIVNQHSKVWNGISFGNSILQFYIPEIYNNLPWEMEANNVAISIGSELLNNTENIIFNKGE